MMRRLFLAIWAVVAVACGGSAGGSEHSEVTEGSEAAADGAETVRPPLLIAAAAPAEPDGQALERAAQDCDRACRYVTQCVPAVALEQCMERCRNSRWVESNATRCLALRILWIDEDGCPRIAPTWQLFDDADDCSGPPPDERGPDRSMIAE